MVRTCFSYTKENNFMKKKAYGLKQNFITLKCTVYLRNNQEFGLNGVYGIRDFSENVLGVGSWKSLTW